jgi:hypothetical protein
VATVARLVSRGLYLPVVRAGSLGDLPATPGAGRGWHGCADLLSVPGALDGWLAAVTAQLARTHHRPPPPEVPATYLMGWYLDVVARVGATWFGLVRRVPAIGPEALAVHLCEGGWPDGAALLSPAFRCLPHDPAAAHPDAEVVPDERALAQVLRADVTGHAGAFHTAYRPDVKIGSRQRWGMVDDMLEAAAWATSRLRSDAGSDGTDDGTDADAEALVGPNPTRLRRTCCFAYRLDEALLCTRCPRRS